MADEKKKDQPVTAEPAPAPEKPVEEGIPKPADQPGTPDYLKMPEPTPPSPETKFERGEPLTRDEMIQMHADKLGVVQGLIDSVWRAFSRVKRGGINPEEIDAGLNDLRFILWTVQNAVAAFKGEPAPLQPKMSPDTGSPTPSPGQQSTNAQTITPATSGPAMEPPKPSTEK